MTIIKNPILSEEDDLKPSSSVSEAGRSDGVPPTYEFATTTAGSSYGGGNFNLQADAGIDPSPPPHATRALAPVSIIENNSAIQQTFVVLADKKPSPSNSTGFFGLGGKKPEVYLKSSNGRVTTQLWWEGFEGHQGPVSVEAHSSNGQVKVSIVRFQLQEESDFTR